MNWARGLFRLWLVVSMLWVVLASLAMDTPKAIKDYLGSGFIRTDVAASDVSLLPISENVFEAVVDGRSFEIETPVTQRDSAAWTRMLDSIAEEFNRTATLENARVRSEAIGIILTTILPPLLVFTLGISLLWALRGFSQGRKK
jgi:hypothetical protein